MWRPPVCTGLRTVWYNHRVHEMRESGDPMRLSRLVKAKQSEILRIAASHGARSVRVFGSAARGTLTRESDIDILVALERGRGLLDLVAMKQDMEDLLGREVHVVTEASISPYMRDRVLKDAVDL